jgi:ParB-like chromosome segregation protein Spo0J
MANGGKTFGTIKVESRNCVDLIPFARNSRTHSEAQIAQIAASIKEFGWTNPILIGDDNGIIAGHGRLLAARKLGMGELPVIVMADLSDAQKRALVIADNKLALNAGWDMDMLSSEIEGLNDDDFDLSLLGFDETELGNFLIAANFEPGTYDDQGKLDSLSPIMVICPNCKTEFNTREA